MRVHNSTNCLKLTSNPDNVEQVESFLQQIATRFGITPDTYGNILISLTEAVNNAIIHGNRSDMSKTVEIRSAKSRDRLSFVVKDQGRGFDYKSLPDPTTPENRYRCGGRGVFLMRELCDCISFRDNGSAVELKFKI
jgi:serine/threonine-protein kinase RsbW